MPVSMLMERNSLNYYVLVGENMVSWHTGSCGSQYFILSKKLTMYVFSSSGFVCLCIHKIYFSILIQLNIVFLLNIFSCKKKGSIIGR